MPPSPIISSDPVACLQDAFTLSEAGESFTAPVFTKLSDGNCQMDFREIVPGVQEKPI